MVDFHKAIKALHTDVVTVNGDTEETITAYDEHSNKVTINWTQVNSWTDPEQYKYDRQQAYASIEEQLDMQYWDSVNGTTTWKDHINQVKAAHPKPTE
jgi:hypothetical protein